MVPELAPRSKASQPRKMDRRLVNASNDPDSKRLALRSKQKSRPDGMTRWDGALEQLLEVFLNVRRRRHQDRRRWPSGLRPIGSTCPGRFARNSKSTMSWRKFVVELARPVGPRTNFRRSAAPCSVLRGIRCRASLATLVARQSFPIHPPSVAACRDLEVFLGGKTCLIGAIVGWRERVAMHGNASWNRNGAVLRSGA